MIVPDICKESVQTAFSTEKINVCGLGVAAPQVEASVYVGSFCGQDIID